MKYILKPIFVILLIAVLPYYNTLFYTFDSPSPFKGDVFYNPYEQDKGEWVKANFHAHSELLLGLTNGENTEKEMYEKYDSLGYDLPCLSNYNTITPNQTNRTFYTNVYEHGINLGFTHQLVFNTKNSSRFDYPFIQFTSHKQHIINRLKTNDNLIALAHANFKAGYSLSDLKVLTNYDLMEVVSRRANSVAHWDMALSSGEVVWAIGNDDSHEIESAGIVWTMINVNKKNNSEVIDNLRSGNCYATKGWKGQEMMEIESVNVEGNNYELTLKEAADSIILKSDNGVTVATAINTNVITYQITQENTYVRAEIFETEPWNLYTKTYLNPIIRTSNGTIDSSIKPFGINYSTTILYFICLLAFSGMLLWLILKW